MKCPINFLRNVISTFFKLYLCQYWINTTESIFYINKYSDIKKKHLHSSLKASGFHVSEINKIVLINECLL